MSRIPADAATSSSSAVHPSRKGHTGRSNIVRKRIRFLRPSPDNLALYRPIDPSDPEIVKLAESIKKHGIMEPLVITEDRFIISGHRRFCAAKLAGKVTVPCIVEPFEYNGNRHRYLELLREHNRQRDKTFAEKLREEIVTADPEECYSSLIAHRQNQNRPSLDRVVIQGVKRRHELSPEKAEMVEHIKRMIFEDRRRYWPLTVRVVHYSLLNYQFFQNSRQRIRYRNTQTCYSNLSNVLTRLRLSGDVPWEAVTDETRPVTIWNVWADPRRFIREQFDGFLKGYWRDLMQSQPHHIEVVVEKNTAYSIVTDVTARYCIPTMSGRGFASIEPWHDVYQRYLSSGKQRLIVIVVSDFDPEGEEIVQVAGRTLRDDFEVAGRKLDIVKSAVTAEQIQQYDLPDGNFAKQSGSRYKKFADEHGDNVYELEALHPETLKGELTETIDCLIDTDAFNSELEAEKTDARLLEGTRRAAHDFLKDLDIDSAHG